MDAERKAELLEAVNTLIEAADASDLYKKLVGVYEVANKGLPVRLVGPAAALNPILELMLEDYPTAERVIELVDAKRAEADLPELDPGFDRAAYMRELMAKKRQRQQQAAPQRERGGAKGENKNMIGTTPVTVLCDVSDVSDVSVP